MFGELLISYLVFFPIAGAPGLLIAGGGWWLSKRINNSWIRMAVRSGLLAFALAPTEYGHITFYPASMALCFPLISRTPAIKAIAIGWIVAFGFLLMAKVGHMLRRQG